MGLGSNFQSPVWKTEPALVRSTMAFDSGMECVIGCSVTLNGPSCSGFSCSRMWMGTWAGD